jgi:hypothetical protein
MKLKLAFAALLALAPTSFAGPAAAQQAYCPYSQTCQNGNPNGTPVPFPVINPFAGLNVLNPGKLLQQQQPDQIYRPTTPPPVLPPAHWLPRQLTMTIGWRNFTGEFIAFKPPGGYDPAPSRRRAGQSMKSRAYQPSIASAEFMHAQSSSYPKRCSIVIVACDHW